MADVAEQLEELVRPVRALLTQVEAELLTAETALQALRADRSRLEQVLRRLDGNYKTGKPGPKPKPKEPHRSIPGPEKIDAVRELIQTSGIDRDAIAAHTLRQAGAKAGYRMSADVYRRALRFLHDSGELQLVHASQGGPDPNLYKWLGARENA